MKLKSYLIGVGLGLMTASLCISAASCLASSGEITQPNTEDQVTLYELNQNADAQDTDPQEADTTAETEDAASDADVGSTAEGETGEPAETGEETGEAGASEEETGEAAVSEEGTEETPGTEDTQNASETEETAVQEETVTGGENASRETEDTGSAVTGEVQPVEEETEPEVVVEGDTVTIRVVSGDTSYRIARKMVEAGLISSARDFDNYLVEKKYDDKISVGTYTLTLGSDYETMAKILLKKN